MTWDMFFQHLANGFSLGGVYALIAIGYTMVYGILRLINFAHGDLVMMGSYFAFYGVALFLLPWYVSFPLAIILTLALGVGVERVAYRPLRDVPRISALISAIAVSLFLENLAIVIFGGRPKAFERPAPFAQNWVIGNVKILSLTLYIILTSFILLVAVVYLVYKTKMGRAMRAVSKDFETARLMGIDVNHVISFTFAVGSALAAAGGIMWSMKFPQLLPLMGVVPGLKCFTAAVVGGIGSIQGAMVGGFLLGIGEIMIVALLPELAGWKYGFAYSILILILLIKPTGLLGKRIEEKA
ncbi:MAG: branched-chain amino acid ABC transporter permease [Anaerolineae bacterium]